jgi:hypothetical protein
MQRYRWVLSGALLVVFCATAVALAQQSIAPQPISTGRQAAQPFTPRASAGYGLFYGYPVPYLFFDPYPAGVPSSNALTFYDPAPYVPPNAPPSTAPPPRNTYSNVESVVPGATNGSLFLCGADPNASVPCGGVTFDVSPGDAQVSVEGTFVGTVDGFLPTQPPLALAPGVHYIEVRRPGYRTAVLEVMIASGEVTPYQGALEPLRTR